MNAAVQCLLHTEDLRNYFLEDELTEINVLNPEKSEDNQIVKKFQDLIKKLWNSRGKKNVYPSDFKWAVADEDALFSDYSQ